MGDRKATEPIPIPETQTGQYLKASTQYIYQYHHCGEYNNKPFVYVKMMLDSYFLYTSFPLSTDRCSIAVQPALHNPV